MPVSSKIFTGFRALGFTTNHVPLALRYHHKHKENYVVTCVGKAFHTYNCSKLGITSVSNVQSEEISCLAVDAYLVFTAAGNRVSAFQRGRQVVHTYDGHDVPVHLLLPFGAHLITVDEDSQVKIWDIKSEEIFMELEFENKTFKITSVLHPSTYLNKVVFGSQQGALQLWNIRTSKLLYTFTGWGSAITALEQAPAIDVMAIGLADGQVLLHNIKFDETVIKFMQDWGPVTTISFRTDGHPIMVTGSTVGHIALWNLEEKKLQSQMREAHNGAITGLRCLPSEPLMVTSSPDNSLKVWIFDQPDGGGRLLRQRSGHSAPPHKIRFHGNTGQNVLSAGQDSTMRSFSTEHDRLNKNLGRASFNKSQTKKSGLKKDQHMMPPITEFSSEWSRESDWDGIAACHRGLCEVTTWNYQRSTMGSYRLLPDRFTDYNKHRHTTAQCVAVTCCGNFVLIGYSSGHVDKFNMQSGIHRGTFGRPTAHHGAVRGVVVDALNQMVLTGGADNCIRVWKFRQQELLDTVKLDSQISKMYLHRESSMLAVVTDDFSVIIIDIDTRRIVRRFLAHRGTITDLTFSPDSRWLITTSMDSTIRTWDLPTGTQVDCFLVDSPVTSLTFSPTGDFLATTHVDDLGVYLWSNMTLYTHVALRPLPSDYQPLIMEMPSSTTTSQGVVSSSDSTTEEELDVSEFKSPDQISDELITLSLLPHSRWHNLLNLDVIKQRNKPKEPPKVPKAAPFFLPTVAGLQPTFDISTDKKEQETSRVFTSNLQPLSAFGQLLWDTRETKNYLPVMSKMKEMGASAIDIEIRSLSPEGGGSTQLMEQFLYFIDHILHTKQDFELAQAYLGLFLKLHGDTLSSEHTLTVAAKKLQSSQIEAWNHLQETLNQSLCVVTFLRSAAL